MTDRYEYLKNCTPEERADEETEDEYLELEKEHFDRLEENKQDAPQSTNVNPENKKTPTMKTVLVAIEVNTDDQSIADQCVEATLQNAMGGELISFSLAPSMRALVVVEGGVAEVISDPSVDFHVFDRDNFFDDPDNTARVPSHFSDLVDGDSDLPFEQETTKTKVRMRP